MRVETRYVGRPGWGQLVDVRQVEGRMNRDGSWQIVVLKFDGTVDVKSLGRVWSAGNGRTEVGPGMLEGFRVVV